MCPRWERILSEVLSRARSHHLSWGPPASFYKSGHVSLCTVTPSEAAHGGQGESVLGAGGAGACRLPVRQGSGGWLTMMCPLVVFWPPGSFGTIWLVFQPPSSELGGIHPTAVVLSMTSRQHHPLRPAHKTTFSVPLNPSESGSLGPECSHVFDPVSACPKETEGQPCSQFKFSSHYIKQTKRKQLKVILIILLFNSVYPKYSRDMINIHY